VEDERGRTVGRERERAVAVAMVVIQIADS